MNIGDLNIANLCVGSQQVLSACLGTDVVWSVSGSPGPSPEPIYSAMPLTFEILSSGTIMWKAFNSSNTRTIEYRINDGEWTNITSNTGSSAPTISVVSGDTVQFRGDNLTYCSGFSSYNSFSGTSCSFKLYGNIMSLINSTGFTSETVLQSGYTFKQLFMYCTGLTDASNLILPATTLSTFCYYGMFLECTSLTTAPVLPATTLETNSYNSMFYGCTGLTTSPELPATTLAVGCYNSMFYICTSLSSITCLATNISASNCLTNWVSGVAASGTFIKHPNMTSWTTGIDGIPTGWTVVDADI